MADQAPSDIRIVTGVEQLVRDDERLMFAVGVFDGLHRGHRYLLSRLRSQAALHDARPAVITFDAHPDAVIVGEAPPLLVDPEERLVRLAQAGIAVTVVQHFDDTLRRTTYDAFVRTIADRTHLAGFVMTPDAAFGRERQGTPDALARLGRTMDFDVVVVPPYELDGVVVRSQRVRELIAAGDLTLAARLLGRRHAVQGVPWPDGAVRPTMPFALPPEGSYIARVGPPWRPGWHGRETRVTVDGGIILVPPGRATPGPVRIAFDRRAT
jgi:riboflavin kinase/FMN adenylyltransferase